VHTNICGNTSRQKCHKKAEKKLKYKSSCVEIKEMWNTKCMIILVVTGPTGIVTKGLKTNLEVIPGKHLIDSLQKYSSLKLEA
jgi:hypothetical protein